MSENECLECGGSDNRHWIGCSAHIRNVMSKMPERLRIEAECKHNFVEDQDNWGWFACQNCGAIKRRSSKAMEG